MKSPSLNKTNSENELIPCSPHGIDDNLWGVFEGKILNHEKSQRMADFFGLLGDANRLRILSVLAQEEVCVCDLANMLKMSESAVSHQLRTLKSMRLVAYQKRGRRVYYRLLDHHVLELYRSVAEHLDEVD